MAKEIKNIVAPQALEINPAYIKLGGGRLAKTLFITSYPRYLSTGWFSPLINLPAITDIAIFTHPINTATALKNLRKKSAQVEAQLIDREEKGLVRSPMLETALRDIETLRDSLQQATENLFNISVYITIYANDPKELNKLEERVVNLFEGKLVFIKSAVFEQLPAFNSVLPQASDELFITAPMNSSPAASFFPFLSSSLTSDEGILYGINSGNNTLVIFDRFSLENANTVIFATSGAGKSYAAKLEAVRSLMMGSDVLIIDPENEYQELAGAVGGSFVDISISSPNDINPFDIPAVPKDEDPANVLKSHIVNLTGLVKLMLGKIKPEEEALLDQAITETYAVRDIIAESDFSKKEPPLLSDLEAVLENMAGGKALAKRLYRFTKGSYAGFTNKPTNVDINNRLVVFSLRNLEEELRPIATYIILNFIWNLVRSELKKRIMIVDEAWTMMRHSDGAAFMFSLVKRARKYYLGVTTITQDVEDFLSSPYGRPIITNSALQLLLKQHPATIDLIGKTFNLTKNEQGLLLEAPIGEGLFFAGLKHVIIKVVASYLEDQIITTNPQQLLNK